MRKPSKLHYTDANQIQITSWLDSMILERNQGDLNLLREACALTQVLGDTVTPNGESCLHQGLVMAEILADLNLDDATLAAAVLYSFVQHADVSLELITDHLGNEVAHIIHGAQQMEAVHTLQEKLSQQSRLAATVDNLRKMLLAMVDNVRVVLLKLAEQLCILRNMISYSDEEKRRIAKETLDIYAPLANRLGVGHLKWQLEDLSFRYLEPHDYQELSRGLKDRRLDRELYVQQLLDTLRKELTDMDIRDCDVTGRAKHIYSIFRKMQRKKVSLTEIYDAIAVRILVPTVEDCYAVLGIVHSLWEHIPKEFDDYIIHPKANGYRSIHTAVIGPERKFVEIQIRTFAMHEEAELGVAAHWVYKEGKVHKPGYEQKIALLRNVMDWQREVTEGKEGVQELYSQALADRIYVFTPNGDVIELPSGATPLDFAYYIHSELGHRCRGAKVNGSIVPLSYALRLGEKVEILTAKQGQPSHDWVNPQLGYLKTSRARAKVLAWFRKQDYDRHALDGQESLEKELKRLGLTKRFGVKDFNYDDLAQALHVKSREDMFAAIGRGDMKMSHVLLAIQSFTEGDQEKLPPPTETYKARPTESTKADIVVGGVSNLLTHLAKCCKPIPGDVITGYVTMGRGVSIHRDDCPNVIERFSLSEDRKVTVAWGDKTSRRYPVDLTIYTYTQEGLLHDMVGLLANERIPVIAINNVSDKHNQTTTFYLTLEIDSLNLLSRIISRLGQLKGVISVHRD